MAVVPASGLKFGSECGVGWPLKIGNWRITTKPIGVAYCSQLTNITLITKSTLGRPGAKAV